MRELPELPKFNTVKCKVQQQYVLGSASWKAALRKRTWGSWWNLSEFASLNPVTCSSFVVDREGAGTCSTTALNWSPIVSNGKKYLFLGIISTTALKSWF